MNTLIVDIDKVDVDTSIIELVAEKRLQTRNDGSIWEYYFLNLQQNVQELTPNHSRLNRFCDMTRLKYNNLIININGNK